MVEYATAEEFLIDYTANVSIGGMFIKTREPLELGTRFRIRFRLPTRKKPIEAYAVVRWCLPPDKAGRMEPGMGIQFEELSPRDFAEVERMLEVWEP